MLVLAGVRLRENGLALCWLTDIIECCTIKRELGEGIPAFLVLGNVVAQARVHLLVVTLYVVFRLRMI